MASGNFDTFSKIFGAFRDNSAPAYFHIDGDLSFAELHAGASALGIFLADRDIGACRSPVIIYGHKDRRYLVAYWACILAGRPFIPVEPDVPAARIQRIRDLTDASTILNATSAKSVPPCNGVEIVSVPAKTPENVEISSQIPSVAPTDTMYMMFSSGTSGEPKGIQVSYNNVLDFLSWLGTLWCEFGPIDAITSNVRFCFDVSLFELWTSWSLTKPLSALDHGEFFNSRKYIKRFRDHRVTTWVSTPTMVRRYLADPFFCGARLPDLNTFVFCGEVLPKEVVTELWKRFEGCRVFNSYGPTECTVAVTCVLILPEHVGSAEDLPIGYARTGTRLYVDNRQASQPSGEIMIRGRSVGPGYLKLPEQQASRFPQVETYCTGDFGHVDKNGLWYFDGRMDRECKIQGFRIDLTEVEACIRQLSGVDDVVTEIYYCKDEPRALSAYVIGPHNRSELRSLAKKMAEQFPPHFIPRFWYCVTEPVLNHNSKLNRSKIILTSNLTCEPYVYSHGTSDS